MTEAILGRGAPAQSGHGPLGGRRLREAISRYLARRRTQRELEHLDDRLLADIGLTRGDISFVAAEAAEAWGPATPIGGGSSSSRLVTWIANALTRAQAVRDLRRLPDHLLQDIGIERWQIGAVVDGMLPPPGPQAEAPMPAQAEASPVHELLGRIESALFPLRRWQISRLAAGQMARFGRDTLADIGYVKGDVDWVPEVMAERRLKRPANVNKPRVGAA